MLESLRYYCYYTYPHVKWNMSLYSSLCPERSWFEGVRVDFVFFGMRLWHIQLQSLSHSSCCLPGCKVPWRHSPWTRRLCLATFTTSCWATRWKTWSSSVSCPSASPPRACRISTTRRWRERSCATLITANPSTVKPAGECSRSCAKLSLKAHRSVVCCGAGVCCEDCVAAPFESDPGTPGDGKDCDLCNHRLPPRQTRQRVGGVKKGWRISKLV